MKKKYKRMTVILLCLLMVMLALPATGFAAGKIETDKDVSLTISYHDGTTPIKDAEFAAYQIARIDAYGELTLTDAFEKYKVDYDLNFDIRGKNDDTWRALATTLAAYVTKDAAEGKITATDRGKTDAQGQLTLQPKDAAGNPLQGLYLVLGSRCYQNGKYYDAAPFLVLLPTQDHDTNTWNYHVTVEPKSESGNVPDYPQTITRKVLKVWKDNGFEKQRPQQVTVELLRDGVVYSTVTLNAENNWQYTWENLDAAHSWTVVESVPSDYTVGMTQEGITFVVTNTYQEETPDNPDNPDNPNNPGKPDQPSNPDQPNTPDDSKLPQTGQLWWPVPVLTAAGLLLVVLGLLRARGREGEPENGTQK